MSGKKGQEEEGGGHSVGLWYVSFSDMITLLLSFFVMLTTFSSFSNEAITKFNGAWAYIANYTVFPNDNGKESPLPPSESMMGWADAGSEKPTDAENTEGQHPRESFWNSFAGAYQDRKVLYVASSRLFWGQGSTITPAGREHLKMLAKFLKLVPCQVVIGQSVSSLATDGGDSLERSVTLVEFLQRESSLSAGNFSLASPSGATSKRLGNEPVMEITLLAKSLGT